jgi:hypothetical protein
MMPLLASTGCCLALVVVLLVVPEWLDRADHRRDAESREHPNG